MGVLGSLWLLLFIPVSNFNMLQLRIQTDFSGVKLGQVRDFDNQLCQEFDSCDRALKLELEVFSRQSSVKMLRCEDGMLILGQNQVL